MAGYSVPINVTYAGAGSNPNSLQGQPLEFIAVDTMIDVYAACDNGVSTFSINGYIGGSPGLNFIPPSSPIQKGSTSGAVKTNENFVTTINVPAGTRLTMPTAATGADVDRFIFVLR